MNVHVELFGGGFGNARFHLKEEFSLTQLLKETNLNTLLKAMFLDNVVRYSNGYTHYVIYSDFKPIDKVLFVFNSLATLVLFFMVLLAIFYSL